ncbi:MAG TPA: ankyrin repeat domain-containing protein [Thermoanaerobaculia bacterium]
MTALTDAIRNGDAEAIETLLDAEPELVSEMEGNVSPLLFALYHGKRELAHLLLDRGAPLSIGEACALGERERVEGLLTADPASLESRTPDGFPPLGLAVFFGQPEIARLLIERGADVSAAANNALRVAPVHAAAAACDRDTMRLLLARGADPNARQQLDYTPLHGAASRGDIEMAKLLIDAGADPAARGADGMSPPEVARKYDQTAFAEWFESR